MGQRGSNQNNIPELPMLSFVICSTILTVHTSHKTDYGSAVLHNLEKTKEKSNA